MMRPHTKCGRGVDTRRLQGFYLAISLYVYSYIYYLFLRWVVTFETTSIETNTTNVYSYSPRKYMMGDGRTVLGGVNSSFMFT